MSISARSLQNISNYGSLNHYSTDLSDMIFVPVANKRFNYFCNSQKCTNGAHDAKRILIYGDVKLRYDTDCPNCGSVMFCKKVITSKDDSEQTNP